MNPIHAILALSLAAAPGFAPAHSEGDHAKRPTVNKLSAEEYPFGRQGDPRKARRTINVGMSDAMRFTPGEIVVKSGETVKFVVRNGGKAMHEMVIGTDEELRKHADMMKKHPGMEHDEPNMAHVKPGAKGEITWTFTNPGTYMYGCLIPGHFEAGMKGTIKVVAK